MCTTDSKIIAFSFIVEVKGRRGRPEISVAEEMRRQKEEQEMRDRGGCGSKVAMGIKFTHSWVAHGMNFQAHLLLLWLQIMLSMRLSFT